MFENHTFKKIEGELSYFIQQVKRLFNQDSHGLLSKIKINHTIRICKKSRPDLGIVGIITRDVFYKEEVGLLEEIIKNTKLD